MRIRMLTLAAGPAGVRQIGGEYDLPEAEARSLIAAGAAVLIEQPVPPVDETTAAVRPAAEARPRGGSQGRSGGRGVNHEPKPANDDQPGSGPRR